MHDDRHPRLFITSALISEDFAHVHINAMWYLFIIIIIISRARAELFRLFVTVNNRIVARLAKLQKGALQ